MFNAGPVKPTGVSRRTRSTEVSASNVCTRPGRVAHLPAGARPEAWKAAGVFYGGNIMRAWGEGPTPFDLTRTIAGPVIGFFGDEDPKLLAFLGRHLGG